MSTKEAYENLVGENCTHTFVELVEDTYDFEDNSNCCKDGKCNCDDCNECNCQCDEELSDEEQAEISLIEEYADRIEQSQCECGCDLRNTLYDLFWVGRKVGFSDCKDWMKEVLN